MRPAHDALTRAHTRILAELAEALPEADSATMERARHVAFEVRQITSKANRTRCEDGLPASTLNAHAGMHVAMPMQVRRLTPRECERLQGWPDDHTLVPYRGKPMADGPRYKIIGNGWALPCVQWIGRRMVAECDRVSHNVTGEVTP